MLIAACVIGTCGRWSSLKSREVCSSTASKSMNEARSSSARLGYGALILTGGQEVRSLKTIKLCG